MSWDEQQAGLNGAWHPNQGFSSDYAYGQRVREQNASTPNFGSSSGSAESGYSSSTSSYSTSSFSTSSAPSGEVSPEAVGFALIGLVCWALWTIRDEVLIGIIGVALAAITYQITAMVHKKRRKLYGITSSIPVILGTSITIIGVATDTRTHDGDLINGLLNGNTDLFITFGALIISPGILGIGGVGLIDVICKGAVKLHRKTRADKIETGAPTSKLALGGVVSLALIFGGVGLLKSLIPPQTTQAAFMPGNNDNLSNAFVVSKQLNVRETPGGEISGRFDCANGVHAVGDITNPWVEIVLPDGTHAYVAGRYLSQSQPSEKECGAL